MDPAGTDTRFGAWVRRGPASKRPLLLQASAAFISALSDAGFDLTQVAFDGVRIPSNTINFERSGSTSETDFVSIIFDKYFRLRFQVQMGRRESKSPFRWIRSGAMVWRMVDESIRYQWWGPKWWSLTPGRDFERAIQEASALLPVALRFLDGADAGGKVFEHRTSSK